MPVKATLKKENTDMSDDMARTFIGFAIKAIESFTLEKDVATFIKNSADQQYGITWQCVVGQHFACSVSFKRRSFIYFTIGPTAFLCFKT